MDVRSYNRHAWDRQVEKGNRWTLPVGPDVIAAARRGDWQLVLTPTRPVPREWFPKLAGEAVLCLASGGGQQAPVLAAAGAVVTVLDNSPAQLAQDRLVAERERLDIQTLLGDMADLSAFADGAFGLIFHPWQTASRRRRGRSGERRFACCVQAACSWPGSSIRPCTYSTTPGPSRGNWWCGMRFRTPTYQP